MFVGVGGVGGGYGAAGSARGGLVMKVPHRWGHHAAVFVEGECMKGIFNS